LAEISGAGAALVPPLAVTVPLLVISVPAVVSIERMPLAPAPLTLMVPALTIVLLPPRPSSP
jgi:hypothetical protein